MKFILTALSILFVIQGFSQGLKTSGKKIVNEQGEEIILRGVGPGGWQIMEGYMMKTSGFAGSQHEIRANLIELMGEENTEIFFAKWLENHFTERDVDSLAAWGFNSIRIPMHYNLFTLPVEAEPIPGEHTWFTTGFDLIDNVLTWAEPHGIYVILDLHAAPGGQGTSSEISDYDPSKPALWESQANKDKTVALWTQIADRYKDNPWIGGYDLINEPHWNLPGGTQLRQLYLDITEGIRSVDTEHIIFIEGNWYANDHTGLTPPWDDNMVYSFHKYWSYTNEDDLDWILPLREQHNVPLWMGESGENSNTWFTDAVSLFEDNGIGWAWWTVRKIGDIDSPYAIEINPGYQKILDYWGNNGPRPTEQEAFNGMMQLAENLLVQNSLYRKDIPDALIRQPHTDETIPYSQHSIPGIIYLSDYDLGKNHFAYYDQDVADYNLSTGQFQAWNSGWTYRNDGVDIETNDDQVNSNGYNIGWTNKGEWTSYTVQIAESGVYKADLRLATIRSGSKIHLTIDDYSVTTSQIVSSTGGWGVFETQTIEDLILEEGEHILKIHFDQGSVNASSIEFQKTADNGDEISLSVLTAQMKDDEYSVQLDISKDILPSSLEGMLESFSCSVNGEVQELTAIELQGSRTLSVSLKNPVWFEDVISISYSGNQIQSPQGQLMETINDLSVINILPRRGIFPGKIQAEDFDFQSGLGTESCTDQGGGQNIGYTDFGDYADYKIFLRNDVDLQMTLRLAAQNKSGRIGFYLLENGSEIELTTVNTPVTGGWQTWQSIDTEVFSIPAGLHTLRMKVLSSGFNLNWFSSVAFVLSNPKPLKNIKSAVYPNPTSRYVQFTKGEFDQFVLISLSGIQLMTGIIPKNQTLDLQYLDSGLYILKLLNQQTGDYSHVQILLNK